MAILARLPQGAWLSPESWRTRHRINTRVLWAHVPILVLLGLVGPMALSEAVGWPLVPVAFAVAAGMARSQRARSELPSLGLISTSFVGIELSGGRMDAHLHLLVIIVFVSLYQRWTALAWTVGVTVVHHASVGLLAPERVFGMAHMSHGEALVMVVVHAVLVVFEVFGVLLWWHFGEIAEVERQRMGSQAQQVALDAAAYRTEAAGREAEAERAQLVRHDERATKVVQDVTMIRQGAEGAITAVTAVESQIEMLSTAVSDIAQRSQRAAGTATAGQSAAQLASEEVIRLERAMGEIADINAMIAQLAGQTNLLSLNATIEAARAGEMGKGFAVVASEVKTLANETSNSAAKVSTAIETVVSETEAVARSFAATTAVVSEIQALQVDIAASVEKQATTLVEITRELGAAAAAARGILAGLDDLTRTASEL